MEQRDGAYLLCYEGDLTSDRKLDCWIVDANQRRTIAYVLGDRRSGPDSLAAVLVLVLARRCRTSGVYR